MIHSPINSILVRTSLITVLFLYAASAANGRAESWQQVLEAQFDIVDTFDHYDDFRPDDTDCGSGQEANGPVFSDSGQQGLWGRYFLNTNTPNEARDYIIASFDADKKVGTKSLMLGPEGKKISDTCRPDRPPSPNYTGHQGAAWFTGYFGDKNNTDGSSGYDEVYIFFRAYIPSNSIPTNGEDLSKSWFKYVEGNPYLNTYGVGAKMVNIGIGFTGTLRYHDAVLDEIIDFESCRRPGGTRYEGYCTYGDSENWLYMCTYPDDHGERRYLGMKPVALATSAGDDLNYPQSDGWMDVIDQLGAIEIHIKLESPEYAGAEQNNGNGIYEVWAYDQYGNKRRTVFVDDAVFRSKVEQAHHKINRLWFHGNHRTKNEAGTGDYYYICGEGMECAWWVDDVIIDNQPIGDKYYSLLNSKPLPPRGLMLLLDDSK